MEFVISEEEFSEGSGEVHATVRRLSRALDGFKPGYGFMFSFKN